TIVEAVESALVIINIAESAARCAPAMTYWTGDYCDWYAPGNCQPGPVPRCGRRCAPRVPLLSRATRPRAREDRLSPRHPKPWWLVHGCGGRTVAAWLHRLPA